jgi:hypothetical protein
VIKGKMGIAARGRKRIEDGDSFQLREMKKPYCADFKVKNNDIEGQNTYYWN